MGRPDSIPVIKINEIEIDQLQYFAVEDISAKLWFGRCYVLKGRYNSSSKELTIGEIFDHVKNLSKKGQTLSDFQAAKNFLDRLKKTEDKAIEDFNGRSKTVNPVYAWLRSLFDFGSYSSKVDRLAGKINEKYASLSDAELSTLTPAQIKAFKQDKRDACLIRVIDYKLASDNPLSVLDYIEEISDEAKWLKALFTAEKLYLLPIKASTANPTQKDYSNRIAAMDLVDKYAANSTARNANSANGDDLLLKCAYDAIDVDGSAEERAWVKENVVPRLKDQSNKERLLEL